MPTKLKKKPKRKAIVAVKPSVELPPATAETQATKTVVMYPNDDVPSLCVSLQNLQRQRAIVIKSRIMQANRLQAIVAGTLGYSSDMAEKERLAKFKEASTLIEKIRKGDAVDHAFREIVTTTLEGIGAFDCHQAKIDKQMLQIVKQFPVAAWVGEPEQRGFGLPSLATLIGETGDLNNYAGPAKLWKRMGCAPFQSGDKVAMGSTWRFGKEGKLSAEEWTAFGYSPRRRSIAFVIGNCLVKGNKSIYRARYDDSKLAIQLAHADFPPMRCDRHGMLLATKLLLKNLWVAWRA